MTLPTAAPWMVTINHSDRTYKIWDEDGNYHDSDEQEREANRALIEAAPDLLDALIAALPYVETALEDRGYKPATVYRMCGSIRAAIAKATGTK